MGRPLMPSKRGGGGRRRREWQTEEGRERKEGRESESDTGAGWLVNAAVVLFCSGGFKG